MEEEISKVLTTGVQPQPGQQKKWQHNTIVRSCDKTRVATGHASVGALENAEIAVLAGLMAFGCHVASGTLGHTGYILYLL